MSNSLKSEAILDSDDFDMDDIITEFAQEELKNKKIVELTDSDDEMETLLDEFAETQSNSDSDKNKGSANVILPSSDDDMDDILEEFREENSPEIKSSPVEVKPDLSQKSQSETRTIIIKDSDNNNGTIYDSSVEILVSDDIDNKSEESFVLDENEDIFSDESDFTSLSKENDNYSIEKQAIKCPNDDGKTVLDFKIEEEDENDLIPLESILSAQSEKDLSIDTKNTLLSRKDEHEELDIKSSCSKIISPEDKSENLLEELRSKDKKDLMNSNTEVLQENASITKKYTESSNILLSDKYVNSFAAPNSPGGPSVPIKISNVEKSETNTELSKLKVSKDDNEASIAIEIFSTSETNVDVLPKNTTLNQNIPEDTANADVLPKDTSVNQNIPEDAANVNVLLKDTSVNQNIPEDTANADVLPKDTSINQNIPEDAANVNVLLKDTSVNQNIPEDTANADVLPKYTSVNQNIPEDAANVNVLPKDTSVNQNILEDESLDSVKSEKENLFSDSDSMDDDNKVILKISEKLDDLEAMSGNASLSSGSEQADVKFDDKNFLSFGNSDNNDDNKVILKISEKLYDLETMSGNASLSSGSEQADVKSDDKNFLSFGNSDNNDDNKVILKIGEKLDDLEAMSSNAPLSSGSDQADVKSDDKNFLSFGNSDNNDDNKVILKISEKLDDLEAMSDNAPLSLGSDQAEDENFLSFGNSDNNDNNKVILKIGEKLDDLEVMSGNAPLSSGSEQADVKSDDKIFLSFGNSDNKDNVGTFLDVQKVLDSLITKIENKKLYPTPENDCDLTSDDKIEVMDIDLNITLTSIVPSVETMKDILASVKLNDSVLKQDFKPGSKDSKKDDLKSEITNDSSDVINESEKSKESSGESPGNHTTNVQSLPENTSIAVSENLNKVSEALPTTKDADSPLTVELECEIEEILVIEPEKPKPNVFETIDIEKETNTCSTEKNLSVTEDIVKETLNNHFNELISKESKKRKLEVSDEETVNKMKRIDNGENDISATCLIDSSDEEFNAHPGKGKVQWNSEKLVVTDKDIEKIAQESIQKIHDRYYSQELEEVTTKLKNFKLEYEKISEIVNYFRKMQLEFRSSQKLAMLKTVYTKPTFRTVGVNVKICKEIEVRRPSLTKNTETVEIIEEKSVTKEPRGYKRPKTPEKKPKPTYIPTTSELPTSKYAIDLPSNAVCKEKLLLPGNVLQSQAATKKVPVTSATQRTPLPNILKPAISRNIVEPPKEIQPKTVAAPVTKVPTMNGEIKGTHRGANVLIPFNDFLQMLPNAGRGFLLPQTRPSSSVPTAPTSVVRTIMVPRQDPRLSASQTLINASQTVLNASQTFFQNRPNQQLYHSPAFQVANAVQRKTVVCPVRPMMVPQAPTAGNPPQKVAPVMRYNQNFHSANFTTTAPGQTTQVFTQYRPVSSSFRQPLQSSLPKTSTIHHPPSKPIQSPARFTSTSLLGSSILRQSLFAPSNQPLIGQPIAATKEYVQLLNTKPYPQVPVSPSYSDTNAKPLPPKPELKASKKNDNKSIVLSWNLALTDKHASVTGYHIFSCQVKNANNETKGWKKTGEVGAMVLPMACTLQQFENDTSYHFIVRAIDKLQRLGPFSDPVSISF